MPVEEGYNPRIMPQAGAAMPLASPETYGAALFKGAAELGDTVHETQLRAYQVERKLTADRENADVSVRLAKRQGALQAATNQLETEWTPDHVAKVKALLDQGREDLSAGVTEESVANRIRVQAAEQDAEILSRAEVYSQVKEAKRTRDNMAATLDTLDNNVATATDRATELTSALRQWGEAVGKMHNVDDLTREQLGRDGEARLHTTALLAQSETTPDAVDALLKTGVYNGKLSSHQMTQVERGIALGRQARDVAAREAEAAANRQAEENRKAAKQKLDAIGVMIDNGDIPSLTTINAAIGQARTAGVPEAEVLKAGYLGEAAGWGKAFQGMSNVDLEARAMPLRQRQAAGQLDPQGVRELGQINRTLENRTKHQADQLGELWHTGPAGQVQALSMLRQMPLQQRDQLTVRLGGNAAVLSRLEERSAQTALHGAGVRKARPLDFMPVNKDTEKPDEQVAWGEFDRIIGSALKNQLGTDYREVGDTALDLYVGSQARSGVNGGWTAQRFETAVQVVFGGSVRRDGTRQGGIGIVRGRQTYLPGEWNAAEFDRAFSRNDFAKMGVTYDDGKPVSNQDVLRNYQLVVADEHDDGSVIYQLEDASGRRLQKGGKPYLLTVSKAASPALDYDLRAAPETFLRGFLTAGQR